MNNNKKFGYISIIGLPNAGKSTLLNSLLQYKLASVSRKPQMTRNRILGVLTYDDTQAVFLDSPGIHYIPKANNLNHTLNSVAFNVAKQADVIWYLIDVKNSWTKDDAVVLGKLLQNTSKPTKIILSKCDTVKKVDIKLSLINLENKLTEFFKSTANLKITMTDIEIICASAKRKEDIQSLKSLTTSYLPDGDWLYNSDDITDRSEGFLVAEAIREQVFRQTGQEIPYTTAVMVDEVSYRQKNKKDTNVYVDATIYTANKHHKSILLGKSGTKIKAIGSESRISLEKYFDLPVYLDLKIKVKEKWHENDALLHSFAHLNELDITELNG